MWWRISLSRGCKIACGRVGVRGGGAELRRGSFRRRGRSPSTRMFPGGTMFFLCRWLVRWSLRRRGRSPLTRMIPGGTRFSSRSKFRRGSFRRRGRSPSSKRLFPGAGRSHGNFFSGRRQGLGRFVSLQGIGGKICFFGRSLGDFFWICLTVVCCDWRRQCGHGRIFWFQSGRACHRYNFRGQG